MGRHRRDLATSSWHHIVNRGADRQDIFSDHRDFELFERLLGESFERENVSLVAYALMTNHFHLVVNASEGNVSSAMQQLCGRYGSAYNIRVRREGPLFTGRFRSKPITDDSQLIQTIRYVHRNPLAIVPPNALHGYRWSSLPVYTLARSWPSSIKAISAMETELTGGAHLDHVLEAQSTDSAVGPWFEESPPPTCEDIETALATVVGRPVESVCARPGRSDVDLRPLLLMLTLAYRSASPDVLADRYGLESSSVRRLARRGRVDVVQDPMTADLRRRVVAQLAA